MNVVFAYFLPLVQNVMDTPPDEVPTIETTACL